MHDEIKGLQKMSTREEVYKAIDTERAYQETLWKELDKINTPADFLIYIQQHVDKAIKGHNASHDSTINYMRKIAALAVAAMERHGAITRK